MASAEDSGPDPIDVGVGLRLRSLRRERGVSQQELGLALGITFQQVQKYERGSNRVSASMLVKAARALRVDPASLLPADDAPQPKSPLVLRILAEMRGGEELVESYAQIKSPKLRKALLRVARSLAELDAAKPDPGLD